MTGLQLADLPQNARILAIRMSALGDIVFALPVLDALHDALPNAKVDWLVEDHHAAVLEGHPAVHEVIQMPRKSWKGGRGVAPFWHHLRGLKKRGQYDLILDFQSNLKSALQLLFLKSPAKVGFAPPVAREGAHRFHKFHAQVPARAQRTERDLQLLRTLGWTGSPNFDGRWALDGETTAQYADLHNYELLHTTTTVYGQDKLWPIERWAELAIAMREVGKTPLLLWTPADKAKVEEVAALSKGAATLAPATPSLAHLMALSDGANCLIGTDSGPVHLAAYRGTQVIALFGPTDPVIYHPPGEKVQIVYAGEEGVAPPPRDRSKRSPWMDKISVSMVIDALSAQ
ncbi:MAG: glycosyltransferase family 9 protein [Planctomycetota bacterium]|nr:glycosyltransferase family 9 protein [Planctomycetota bacterium]MDA1113631.1 glycosyltransferase family 9 protein [Planctomycetota bacterium]